MKQCEDCGGYLELDELRGSLCDSCRVGEAEVWQRLREQREQREQREWRGARGRTENED